MSSPLRSNVSVRPIGIAVLCWMAVESALAAPDPQIGFPTPLQGSRVRFSSIALGDLDQDGLPEIVVGTDDGMVHAYKGTGARLWDFDTGEMGIDGKAAIADIDGDGFNEVVVGAGSTVTPGVLGGLYVLSHTGALQCSFPTKDGGPHGVFSSPAVADLVGGDGGKLEIAFGGFDRWVRVIEHDCELVWERNVFDSVFSSPAIGDVNRDGQLDVVIGGDADSNNPVISHDGGFLYVYDGETGSVLPGFPTETDEVIWSAPALGDITGDGWLEIVVGTGYCWASPDCPTPRFHPGVGEYVNAWDHNGNVLPGWPVPVAAGTHPRASPALADLDNDGLLEVVVNSRTSPNSDLGMVYALNGDGSNVPGWPTRPRVPAGPSAIVHASTEASPIVADVTGDGSLEVMLVSAFDLVVWDKDGVQLSRDEFPPPPGHLVLESKGQLSSSAAVDDVDGDGDLEVLIGSSTDITLTTGAIYAWDFPGPDTPKALAWPMFRGRPDNNAIIPTDSIFSDGFESGDTSAWSSASSP